jgi:hypothetical protein
MASFTPEEIKRRRAEKTTERKQQVQSTAQANAKINLPSEAGSALTLVSHQSHANGVQFVKQVAETSFAQGIEDGVAAYFALSSDDMMRAMFPDGLPQISDDVTFTVTPLLLEGERFPEPNV